MLMYTELLNNNRQKRGDNMDYLDNYCSRCNQKTRHQVCGNYEKTYRDDYICDAKYMIIECCGCGNTSFRYEFHDIEAGYPIRSSSVEEEWYVPKTVDYYPKVLENHTKMDGIYNVPEIVRNAYQQSLAAFTEGANILAGLGFRSVIEAICNDQKITGRDLETRINKLCAQGIISKKDARLMHGVRFLGNDAAHEIKSPESHALRVVLTIVEHMIRSLYILEKETKGIFEIASDSYDEFMTHINKNIKNYKKNDELPISEILGKSFRLFKQDIALLEQKLCKDITAGNYKKLALGKLSTIKNSNKTIQNYIIQ